MKIRPTGDLVLILPEEATVGPGQLVVPDSTLPWFQVGTIVAAGPGGLTRDGDVIEPRVQEGDRVLYPRKAGAEVPVDGRTHILIREGALLGHAEGPLEHGVSIKPVATIHGANAVNGRVIAAGEVMGIEP